MRMCFLRAPSTLLFVTTPMICTILYLDNFSFEVFNGNVIAKPTGLEVTYDGGTEATVIWTSDEETFDIEVNGNVTEDVANPFTLTGLEYATTYTIRGNP